MMEVGRMMAEIEEDEARRARPRAGVRIVGWILAMMMVVSIGLPVFAAIL